MVAIKTTVAMVCLAIASANAAVIDRRDLVSGGGVGGGVVITVK